jgi:hypothetical protein
MDHACLRSKKITLSSKCTDFQIWLSWMLLSVLQNEICEWKDCFPWSRDFFNTFEPRRMLNCVILHLICYLGMTPAIFKSWRNTRIDKSAPLVGYECCLDTVCCPHRCIGPGSKLSVISSDYRRRCHRLECAKKTKFVDDTLIIWKKGLDRTKETGWRELNAQQSRDVIFERTDLGLPDYHD